MNGPQHELKLLAMEENLAGPKGDEYAKKYDRVLLKLKKRAQAAIEEGLDQHQFAAANALIEATDTARKIIIIQRKKSI